MEDAGLGKVKDALVKLVMNELIERFFWINETRNSSTESYTFICTPRKEGENADRFLREKYGAGYSRELEKIEKYVECYLGELAEMYVYILEKKGPENLSLLPQQLSLLEPFTEYDLKKFTRLVDDLEAFLLKLLHFVDADKYSRYSSQKSKTSLLEVCKLLGLIREDYYKPKEWPAADRVLYSSIKHIYFHRCLNTHRAPYNDIVTVSELIWETLFVELYAVGLHAGMVKDAECRNAVKGYAQAVSGAYDFNYIQIEYEQDGENHGAGEDSALKAVRGTADNIMKCIRFEETPCIKLVDEAGKGKTRLLEYINYKLLEEIAWDDAGTDKDKVFPLYIRCNDSYGDQGDMEEHSFTKTVRKKIRSIAKRDDGAFPEQDLPEEKLRRYLSAHYKILYLLDGLNEIYDGTGKIKFINELQGSINSINKNGEEVRSFFIITERYSSDSVTVKENTILYKFSKLSDEIRKEFFSSRNVEWLYDTMKKRLAETEDVGMKSGMEVILNRPFYLEQFCLLAQKDEKELPSNAQELMGCLVQGLFRREWDAQNRIAVYGDMEFYMIRLAELIDEDNKARYREVLPGFQEVRKEYGLGEEYNAKNVLNLFQQLGFLRVGDGMVYVEDIYADYMRGL